MPKGSKLIRPKKIVMIVGPPINPPRVDGRVPRRVVGELTRQLHVSLQQLFDDGYRLDQRGRPVAASYAWVVRS